MDRKAKIITINSGNSGAGKTCTAVNIAVLLAQKGYKVCLFDADAKLENVNIMLNLFPDYTLQDVLSGEKTLNEVTLHANGLDVIPGATGLTSFISLSKEQQSRLQNSMLKLKSEYDYLIIDNTAGISNTVSYYTKISNYCFIVITPDTTSLSAAFSLIRVLQKRDQNKKYQILVNNVSDENYARRIFKRFFTPIEKHIGCQINYLGCIISDEMIPASICIQNPVVLEYPSSPSSFSFNQLARRLISVSDQLIVNNDHGSKKNILQKPQADCSTNTTALENDKNHAAEQITQQPTFTEQLKDKVIRNINDQELENQKLKEMVLEINNAYTKRFGGYATDLPHVIHDALKKDHLSENTLRNLLMTMYSLYQDQYGEKSAAENIVSTSQSPTGNLTQESVNLLIKLLQQQSLSNLQIELQQTSNTADQKTPQLASPSEQTSPLLHDLLESIRYASMVDK